MPEETQSEQTVQQKEAHEHTNGDAGRQTAAAITKEGPSLATTALVGIGVAVVEPELIPGMLIGAGAALAPKLLPTLGSIVRPLVKTIVKAGYVAVVSVREMVAEAGEQMDDMLAEVRAEHQTSRAHRPEAPEGQPQPQAT